MTNGRHITWVQLAEIVLKRKVTPTAAAEIHEDCNIIIKQLRCGGRRSSDRCTTLRKALRIQRHKAAEKLRWWE